MLLQIVDISWIFFFPYQMVLVPPARCRRAVSAWAKREVVPPAGGFLCCRLDVTSKRVVASARKSRGVGSCVVATMLYGTEKKRGRDTGGGSTVFLVVTD